MPGAATFGCAARRAAAGGRARQAAAAAAAAGPWGRGGGRRSDSPRCAAKRSGQSGSGRAGPHPARRGTCSPRGKARPCPRTGRRGRSKRGGGEREGAGGCGAGGARLRALCGAGASPPPPRRPPPGSCRLALYVYEYLLHVGAQKSAQTFLSEVSPPAALCAPPPPPGLHLVRGGRAAAAGGVPPARRSPAAHWRPLPFARRSGGRRTSRWESPPASCTPGGGE